MSGMEEIRWGIRQEVVLKLNSSLLNYWNILLIGQPVCFSSYSPTF